MEITERAIHLLTNVAKEVRARFADFNDLTRGWEHVHRVYHLALHLAEQENADGLIVGMEALMHDLGPTAHGPARLHVLACNQVGKSMYCKYHWTLLS